MIMQTVGVHDTIRMETGGQGLSVETNLPYVPNGEGNLAFRAAIEACEEAILSSLHASETLIGKDGHVRYSLKDTLAQMKKSNENT